MTATLHPMLVDGRWVTSGSSRQVRDPQDGKLIALVPEAGTADVSRAVAAADRAVRAGWTRPVRHRAEVLRRAAAGVAADAESLARTIAKEGVKTIREARGEVARCVTTLGLAAAEANRIGGEVHRFDAFASGDHRLGYWTRDPVGVVAAITPFNDPLNLVAHKVAPAIAAGNAVIVKPHEQTPLSALRLAEVLTGCGLPDGVLQVVTGRGDVVGDALVRDPRVGMVSFTGGPRVGRRVARAAGTKRTAFELGGPATTIVLDDADLDLAVELITSGAFAAAGQNCLHVQNLLVHRAVYTGLRERLVAAAESLRLGDKLDESTDMGPVIDEQAAERVLGLVEDACAAGARLLTGGKRVSTLVSPTLLDQVPDEHDITRTEVFGPVTVLRPVESVEDAIAVVNSGTPGMQTAIFTRSLEAAFTAVRRLRTGAVIVNDSTDYRTDGMPFGGPGASSGREGVRQAIEAMTEPKVVCISLPPGTPAPG